MENIETPYLHIHVHYALGTDHKRACYTYTKHWARITSVTVTRTPRIGHGPQA